MRMFRVLLFLYLITCSAIICAQNRISGHLSDNEGRTILHAKVEIISSNDSTCIAKLESGDKGIYSFNNLLSGSYIVKASAPDRKPVSKKIMLFKNSSLKVDFVFDEKMIILPEVMVKSVGISINGDTTKYFANHYKTGQERVLRDVLEKLPGVNIDPNTNVISANGKPVRKILMEKQDLFQGNTSIPMDNLSSEGINSIEVIDNYSEYNILDGFRSTNETVINLNMNNKMKGHFNGQVDVQAGINNKYFVKNSSLVIGKKMMFSGIASANNIGNSVLKASDIISANGGLSEILSNENPQESIEKSIKAYSSFIDSRKNLYKRNNGILSLNSVFIPSQKVKILWNGILGLDRYRLMSNDHYEYFFSNLKYDDFTKEKQLKQHFLHNIKVAIIPTKSFNIFYTGKLYVAHQDQSISSSIAKNQLFTNDINNSCSSENNLLAVKKIGINSLNLSLDFNYRHFRGDYSFNADTTFYDGMFGLSDSYLYDKKHIDRKYSAQLFYLHRLNNRYFLRFGAQCNYDKSHFYSDLQPEENKQMFLNRNYVGYLDNNLNIRLVKDRGKLTFTTGLSIKLIDANNDIKREQVDCKALLVVPNIKLSYKLSNFHLFMLSYDELFKTNTINNLIDKYDIRAYNQIIHSSVNSLSGYVHKVSFNHMLMIPISGFFMINMASFDFQKNDIVDDYSMKNIISVINKRSYSGAKSFNWMTSLEKKFIFMPLDTKINFNFTHNFVPFFKENILYKSKNNMLNIRYIASTHYKKGLNGKFMVDYMNSHFNNRLGKNKILSTDYLCLASYNTSQLYASIDLRYRDYRMNGKNTHDLFYDFTCRYDFSDKMTLQITGNDITHINNRIQTEGTLNNYYTNYRSIYYMPGNIMLGLIVKY